VPPGSLDSTIRARTSVRAPRGNALACKGWQQEAALRMLMNTLDPEVAERPKELESRRTIGRAISPSPRH
jgi:urocanate hydratase